MLSYEGAKQEARLMLSASSKVHQMGSDYYPAAAALRMAADNILKAAAYAAGKPDTYNPYFTLYTPGDD